MPYIADRVKDTTTSTGTGAITLAGSPPSGFQSFATAFGTASLSVGYCLVDSAGNWEVGEGTFNGTTGLTRDIVRSSSNAGALVTIASGTTTVFADAHAQFVSNSTLGQQMAQNLGWALP